MTFPSQKSKRDFYFDFNQYRINFNWGIFSLSSFLLQQTRPNIYLSHEVFQKSSNSWAIKPILIDIFNQLIKPKTKWFVLCDSNSVVNLRKLLTSLDAEDETKVCVIEFVKWNYLQMCIFNLSLFLDNFKWQETYLGYSLYDREATIIHHFAFFRNPSEFHYPYVRAGVAFSVPLLNRSVIYQHPSPQTHTKSSNSLSL